MIEWWGTLSPRRLNRTISTKGKIEWITEKAGGGCGHAVLNMVNDFGLRSVCEVM